MAEDMGDKSELPTSRRLEEARSRGQIAKSQDLIGAVDLVVHERGRELGRVVLELAIESKETKP